MLTESEPLPDTDTLSDIELDSTSLDEADELDDELNTEEDELLDSTEDDSTWLDS